MDTAYFILQLIAGICCFICGVFLLTLYIPSNKYLKNCLAARKFLVAAYFVLGAFTVISLIGSSGYNPGYLTDFFLFMSSVQSLLIALSIFALLGCDTLVKRPLLLLVSPVVILLLAFIAGKYGLKSTLLRPTLHYIMCLAYLIQMGGYVYLFFRQFRMFRKEASGFHLKWMELASYSSISVGVLALIAILFPFGIVHLIFIALYTLFYLMFAAGYINYTRVFSIKNYSRLSVVSGEIVITEPVESKNDETENLEDKLERWKQTRQYLNAGLTMEMLCKEVGVNRTYLSAYINSQYRMNYNTWVNQLRIEEAKELIKSHKEIALSDVAENVGFADLAHFSKQFKSAVGVSPSQWRNMN